MASSTTQTKIISLGNQLVALISEKHDSDFLSRWMAHYVAEQITLAESATGEAKAAAETRCYDTILKLWAHRAALPIHPRPFERFEAIFRVLERIDPDSSHGFYHTFNRNDKSEPDSLEAMVQFIIHLDDAARTLLKLGLVGAIGEATDEQTQNLLRDSIPSMRGHDVDAVQSLLDMAEDPEGTDAEKKFAQQLNSQIATLDQFVKTCTDARAIFTAQLKDLEKT